MDKNECWELKLRQTDGEREREGRERECVYVFMVCVRVRAHARFCVPGFKWYMCVCVFKT